MASLAFSIPVNVEEIISSLQSQNFEAFVVGGSIRDVLLGRETHDWDFTTNASPDQIQKIFPDSFYENDFGTVGLKVRNESGETEEVFEITPYRNEGKYSDSRHPDKISWAKTIEEDLARRDFTINSIALTFDKDEQKFVDPYEGKKDLEDRIIRSVGDPSERFTEDALRLMRAIRFASQLGFEIETETWNALKRHCALIAKISSERIRDELIKILKSDFPGDGIKLLHSSGLLDYILPELTKGVGVSQQGTHHIHDVFDHSVNALRFCKNPDWVVRLATLLHDVGKPITYREQNGKATFYNHDAVGAHVVKEIASRLHFSKEERDKLFTLVRFHMFSVSEFLTDSAIRRFIRKVGQENTSDMLDLRIADRLGSGSKETSWRLEDFKERIIEVQKHIPSVTDLKVNGNDVIETLEITPGPTVGQILNQLFEEIMEDPNKNEREFLLNRIKEIGKT